MRTAGADASHLAQTLGDLSRYDIVIETGGHFVSVQIKSTIYRMPEGCYRCSVHPSRNGKPYQPGEFDFLAVYVIAEGVWTSSRQDS